MNLDLIEPGQDPPEPGDLLVTARLVKVITDVRPVESRVWHDRWRIETRTLGPRDPWPTEAVAAAVRPGARCIWTTLYQRGEGPADRARASGLPVREG